jgi:effector-binding domain-containing protein
VVGEAVELTVDASPTAVIAEATTWDAFPQLWPALLSEVWATVRGDDEVKPGRNVMLYLDDVPHVEVGVEAAGPFEPRGRVTSSELPAGRVMTARLVGSYSEIGAAHRAVVEACEQRGLVRLGPLWEVYGHFDETADDQVVDVYHLVAGSTSGA